MDNGNKPTPFTIVPDKTQCQLVTCHGRRKTLPDGSYSALCSKHVDFFLSLVQMLPNVKFEVDGKIMMLALTPVIGTPEEGSKLWTPS